VRRRHPEVPGSCLQLAVSYVAAAAAFVEPLDQVSLRCRARVTSAPLITKSIIKPIMLHPLPWPPITFTVAMTMTVRGFFVDADMLRLLHFDSEFCSPVVVTVTTAEAEALCLKNGLLLHELLR
jgi:hypothetical protein